MALSIECEDFRPLARNTLRGFATIKIKEARLKIRDVAVHHKNSSTWAALPAKPQIKNGAVVTNADGKAQYVNILEFDDRKVSDAFSRAVVDAVLKFNPRALEATNG
jgi:hypothetical protein